MGAVALNGATIEVDDHTQRTRVANAGWFRWAPVVAMCITAHTVSSLLLGRLRQPVRAVLLSLAILSTIETGLAGRKMVAAGDVPVASAVTPISTTPDHVAAAQGRLRRAQWLIPALTAGLWVVNAIQDRSG
jgi:hypothetical protein